MLLSKKVKHTDGHSSSLRGAMLSSGVIAFAGLGDAFLYPMLPVYGKSMGFSVFFIGLLLSVNRFVRILSNTPIANLVNRLGMKKIMVFCALLAVLTTVAYGFQVGLIVFLLARILWGLCYSGLKIATLNYAAQVEGKSGLAFGVTASIKSMGALFVLWFGPLVTEMFGIKTGILIIAVISLVGIGLAMMLPNKHITTNTAVTTKKTFHPSATNLLIFVLSITIDGILVVCLAQLLASTYIETNQLLAMVAFYLLLKKLFTVGVSLLSGFLSLKFAPFRLFQLSVVLCSVGLMLIALDFFVVGIVLAFLFNTIVVAFSPLIAIEEQQGKNALQAISGVSTWWDLGAAIGAFIGIFLIESFAPNDLFLALALLIILLFGNFVLNYGKAN